MFCQECPKKSFCSELCPEARLYAAQDETRRQEVLIGQIKYSNPENLPISPPDFAKLTKTEKKILTLLGMGLNRKEVSKLLAISRENLRVRLFGLKRKFNAFSHI